MKDLSMSSKKEDQKTGKRVHRPFTPMEKCKAVLSVWSERRKPSDICRELAITWMQFNQWQKQALKGIFLALETKKDQVKCPALGSRLEKLLERRAAAPCPKSGRLERRLEKLQQEKEEEKTA